MALERTSTRSGEKFVLPFMERRRLHERAHRAQRHNQSEVCGLMLICRGNNLHLRFLKNRSTESGKYLLSRSETKAAARSASGKGQKVLGTFHSHPISEAIPSPGDLQRGFFRGYELIYDVCGRKARLWRLTRNSAGATPEEVVLTLSRRV
jgi:proteasome lid subunit RPN8/RPN11